MTHVVALVVAAGHGSRAGGDRPKQYRTLAGHPVLRHALTRLAAHPGIDAVQPVIHADDHAAFAEAAAGIPVREPVSGGASRQESVRFGLDALAHAAPRDVLIHDGARPFPDAGLVERVLDGLAAHDAAIPALRVSDTLKRGDGRRIVETVPRGDLWRAQTPQGFRYTAIRDAHHAHRTTAASDDAGLAEAAGLDLTLVDGAVENIKVTTADDLTRAERWLAGGAAWCTGTGFDVHAFADTPGPVRLCGVDVPHDRALAGHSDADAGLHALVDAMLGALGAGDIGQHFPPSDPQWAGADSGAFVAHTLALLRERGGIVGNVDVTLICQAPKVGAYRDVMRSRIADLLEVQAGRVNVKATTTERLGFLGRVEGIAAQASVTLRLPAV